jgi:methyl-accepting chemotaxis protein
MEEKNKNLLRNNMIILLGLIAVIIAALQVIVVSQALKGSLGSTAAVLLIVCGAVINFIFAFAVVKGVADKIYDAMSEANSAADDLNSQEANGIGKASKDLSSAFEELKVMLENMNESTNNISDEVGTMADNTNTQATQTDDIKDKVLAISNSIEKITGNVEQLTNSADVVQEYNNSVENIIKELVEISTKSSQAIENVRQQTDLTNKSAQEIRTATDIIAGISSQTNLLALNASIEAARAGEHGKGFAVVAEEIRALADQSRASTEQIGKVVTTLLGNADESVEITKKVSEAFLLQNQKIQDTEAIFGSLNKEIDKVHDSVQEIGTEVKELDGYKKVIEEEVNSLDDSARENSDSAEATMNNVNNLKNSMTDCDSAMNRISRVSAELSKTIAASR